MKRLTGMCVVIGLVAILASCGTGTTQSSSSPGSLTPVKFVFNFAPGGYDANLVATQEQGFFRAEGLDVSFIVPATGADPAKLIANGQADFGLVHSIDVILARGQGLPIVSVGTTHQFGTAGVMAPASKGIHTLQDLYGKTYGLTGIPADRVMFEQMLKLNHIDKSKIKVITAGFAGVPQLLAGTIDGYEGISWYEPILYNIASGKAPDDKSTLTFIPYYQHGIPRYYTFGIVTSESFVGSRSDVVRRFLRAWVKGLQWSMDNPDAAVNFLVKRYPDVDKTAALPIWKASAAVAKSDETNQHGLGWQSATVWATQAQFFLDNGVISSSVDVNKAMTNDYLPGK